MPGRGKANKATLVNYLAKQMTPKDAPKREFAQGQHLGAEISAEDEGAITVAAMSVFRGKAREQVKVARESSSKLIITTKGADVIVQTAVKGGGQKFRCHVAGAMRTTAMDRAKLDDILPFVKANVQTAANA